MMKAKLRRQSRQSNADRNDELFQESCKRQLGHLYHSYLSVHIIYRFVYESCLLPRWIGLEDA